MWPQPNLIPTAHPKHPLFQLCFLLAPWTPQDILESPAFAYSVPSAWSTFIPQLPGRFWPKIASWVKPSPIYSGENSHSLLKGTLLYLCYCSTHILWWFICLLFSPCFPVNTSRTGTLSLTFIYSVPSSEPELEKACVTGGERGGQWLEYNNGSGVTLNVQR